MFSVGIQHTNIFAVSFRRASAHKWERQLINLRLYGGW